MRKRMFSPDFFSDEELIEHLDPAGRLFYLGVWSVSEDSGVFPMSPLSLRMKIFPGGDVESPQIENYLDTLVSLGKVVPFEVAGKKYGWLRNFHRHQRLDNPSAPILPLPAWVTWHPSENRRQRRYVVDVSVICPGHVPDKSTSSTGRVHVNRREEKENKEGKVTVQDKSRTQQLSSEQLQTLTTLSTLKKSLLQETSWIAELAKKYPRVDLASSALKFVTWVTEHPDRYRDGNVNYAIRFEQWVMEDDSKKRWRITPVVIPKSDADLEEDERLTEVVTSTHERIFG